MSYSDNLPRKIKIKNRCLALQEDGHMCKKTAQYEIAIHNDKSLEINNSLKWARIFVCEEHIPAYEKSQINK